MRPSTPVLDPVRLACAKVNLALHVTGRRADGYHLLDSLVVFPGLGDRLALSPAVDGAWAVERSGRFGHLLPDDPDADLAVRGARAAAGALGLHGAFVVRLEKNLPLMSGIGGGSADAAAAIAAVEAFAGRPIAAPRRLELALSLGADVPVCLAGRPVRMRGIGEEIEPVELPPFALVLVNPLVGVSTPAVFKALAGAFSGPLPLERLGPGFAGLVAGLAACGNDLEAPARRLCPAIGTVLDALRAAPGVALARMSGSGATCFGLVAGASQAAAAAADLARRHPWWWTGWGPVA